MRHLRSGLYSQILPMQYLPSVPRFFTHATLLGCSSWAFWLDMHKVILVFVITQHVNVKMLVQMATSRHAKVDGIGHTL